MQNKACPAPKINTISYCPPIYECQASFPPEAFVPAGVNRPKRKNIKMMGNKKTVKCPPKKIVSKKKKPSCPPSRVKSEKSLICEEKNEPCDIKDKSVCSMSKGSERSISNYLFDNPGLKSTSPTKKISGCGELLDCLDDDSEVWILQCPKSFDINKILNKELNKSKSIDSCSDRFKADVNMVCLTPEKATEYKSICDQIRIIQPVGKIMLREQEVPEVPSDCTIYSEDNNCSISSLPSKKIQKQINDQKFTIETTVTIQNVNDDKISPKKSRKSIKQEPDESCRPFCPPEPVPMKKKKC